MTRSSCIRLICAPAVIRLPSPLRPFAPYLLFVSPCLAYVAHVAAIARSPTCLQVCPEVIHALLQLLQQLLLQQSPDETATATAAAQQLLVYQLERACRVAGTAGMHPLQLGFPPLLDMDTQSALLRCLPDHHEAVAAFLAVFTTAPRNSLPLSVKAKVRLPLVFRFFSLSLFCHVSNLCLFSCIMCRVPCALCHVSCVISACA